MPCQLLKMEIYISIMIITSLVISCVHATENHQQRKLLVMIGCDSQEAIHDIENSVRGIKERLIDNKIEIIYKNNKSDCGYIFRSRDEKDKQLHGVYTDLDLWNEVLRYYQIKPSIKEQGLGYPID